MSLKYTNGQYVWFYTVFYPNKSSRQWKCGNQIGSSMIFLGFIWITNSVRSGFNATQMFWLRVWLGEKLWKRYEKSVIVLPTFTHSFETPFCLSDWCIDRLHNGEKLSENPSNH